jgi:hypothetical protein
MTWPIKFSKQNKHLPLNSKFQLHMVNVNPKHKKIIPLIFGGPVVLKNQLYIWMYPLLYFI